MFQQEFMQIPNYIKEVADKLNQSNFELYIVGGCVRDLLMGKTPTDWDLTTNARPEQILKIFPDSKYENNFGTVLLKEKEDDKTKAVYEITTYRSEQGYNDRRHPDKVVFEDNIEEDLKRRDFTINAMAIKVDKNFNGKSIEIVDLFGGQKDIGKKIIRAVGEPIDRFKEDALRMIRAIRFGAQLNFKIEPKTERAIVKMASSIRFIANERIRDELIKILSSDNAYWGMKLLHKTKLLRYIIPELEDAFGVAQSRHHIYTVFDHCFYALKYCPSKEWQVRLASLLHDIGKPKTRKIIKGIATFYNHEYVGAKMTFRIMKRLKFSKADTDRVVNLVRNHMFYYNVGEVSEASVRRLIKKTGKENLKDLIDVRIADRLGSGLKKAVPYKLRHLQYMMEKVQNDPVSVKMLKVNGEDLMKTLKIKPGPKIGAILDVLLAEVIEDPTLNDKEKLLARSLELDKLNLEELRVKAKEKIQEKRKKDDEKIKKEYWVK